MFFSGLEIDVDLFLRTRRSDSHGVVHPPNDGERAHGADLGRGGRKVVTRGSFSDAIRRVPELRFSPSTESPVIVLALRRDAPARRFSKVARTIMHSDELNASENSGV